MWPSWVRVPRASSRLLEKGKTVLVIEKQDIPGGSMSMTYSGVAAAESELQKNYSLGRFDDTPFINLEAMMELLGTMVDPQFDRFNGACPTTALCTRPRASWSTG